MKRAAKPELPPDVIWPFLLSHLAGDSTALGALADRLEEAGDARGVRLRRRWRMQPRLLARSRYAVVTQDPLRRYLLRLFPQRRGRVGGWDNERLAEAIQKIGWLFPRQPN